jgi:hypothetical protein
MKKVINRVVLVLRSSPKEPFTHRGGGHYSYADVDLISFHLQKQCPGVEIICLWDKAPQPFDLRNNVKVLPMTNTWPKWWAKMNIFSPEMEKYRPFLFVDLDTLILGDLEGLFPPANEHIAKFIALGSFTEERKLKPANHVDSALYSGIMWIPANNEKISQIWNKWASNPEEWMRTCRSGDQEFIEKAVKRPDVWWQQITNKIGSFKPPTGERISGMDGDVRWVENIRITIDHFSVICLHGLPKMLDAAQHRSWVNSYLNECFHVQKKAPLVTIIIPYKVNPKRIWLQDAINSVPSYCQLLISEGPGMWAENFNKVLSQAKGKYIKYLHDDDMLSENCIEDSIKAIEKQGVDFIHGKALELHINSSGNTFLYEPRVKKGTLPDLLKNNFIHSATTMYRREIFEKIGSFDETLPDSEEYEFNLRCLFNGFKLGYSDSVLAIYRRHDASQSTIVGGKQMQETSKRIVAKYQ